MNPSVPTVMGVDHRVYGWSIIALVVWVGLSAVLACVWSVVCELVRWRGRVVYRRSCRRRARWYGEGRW